MPKSNPFFQPYPGIPGDLQRQLMRQTMFQTGLGILGSAGQTDNPMAAIAQSVSQGMGQYQGGLSDILRQQLAQQRAERDEAAFRQRQQYYGERERERQLEEQRSEANRQYLLEEARKQGIDVGPDATPTIIKSEIAKRQAEVAGQQELQTEEQERQQRE